MSFMYPMEMITNPNNYQRKILIIVFLMFHALFFILLFSHRMYRVLQYTVLNKADAEGNLPLDDTTIHILELIIGALICCLAAVAHLFSFAVLRKKQHTESLKPLHQHDMFMRIMNCVSIVAVIIVAYQESKHYDNVQKANNGNEGDQGNQGNQGNQGGNNGNPPAS